MAQTSPNASNFTNSFMQSSENLTFVPHRITRESRQQRFGHPGGVVWLTGLSGSGKSTLAMRLEEHLHKLGYACFTLDGDNIRYGLNANLGFSQADRAENIRRVGEVAALFADAGLICVTAFISPYRQDRLIARQAASRSSFHEIHIAADLATCEARDPKGLYRKARAGKLREFTGIDAPYERPETPELTLDTASESVETCIEKLLDYLQQNFPLQQAAL